MKSKAMHSERSRSGSDPLWYRRDRETFLSAQSKKGEDHPGQHQNLFPATGLSATIHIPEVFGVNAMQDRRQPHR